jgi:hypothetical protein
MSAIIDGNQWGNINVDRVAVRTSNATMDGISIGLISRARDCAVQIGAGSSRAIVVEASFADGESNVQGCRAEGGPIAVELADTKVRDNHALNGITTDAAPRSVIESNRTSQIEVTNGSDDVVVKGNIHPTGLGFAVEVTDSDDVAVVDNDVLGRINGAEDYMVSVQGTSARTRVERNRYHGTPGFGSPYVYGVQVGASAVTPIIGYNDFGVAYPIEELGSTAIEYSDQDEVDFIHFPDAEVGASPIRKYFASAVEIIDVFIVADDAPTGAALIADVHKDGSTIFTTTSNRPTVADGSNEGSTTVPDVTYVAAGSYLKVHFDQIGSTTPGGAVTILLRYRRV